MERTADDGEGDLPSSQPEVSGCSLPSTCRDKRTWRLAAYVLLFAGFDFFGDLFFLR